MNELAKQNEIRRQELMALRDAVVERRRKSTPPAAGEYPLANLRARITQALRDTSGLAEISWEIDILDRARFGADVALRLTSLLKDGGPKQYITTHVPWIIEALRSPALSDVVSEVSHKGIYVNVRLTDSWYLSAVQSVIDLDSRFGLNDSWSDRTQIVDYSSPNVAKTLHAGHLRSTMIGHVLSNLYDACGALVYRLNHINDFGGFGFMLEGYRRFESLFPEGMRNNDRLLAIYSIRRTMERAVAAGTDLEGLPEADREVIATYFPGVAEADELRKTYAGLVAASDARFHRLEEGDADEVALWLRMVEWSLEDFQSFYSALDIDIDFIIGESFYLDAGNMVVDEAVRSGTAFELTKEMVNHQVAELDRAVEEGEMTPEAQVKAAASLEKDIGAIVVQLPGGERLVTRRSDGRSIYATRDLGAIKLRRDIFDPTDINYVVGQEQRVHFSRLFQAAEVIGLATPDELKLKHTYFGFYVDAETGKKLSSRDSVAGVNDLLAESVTYYRAKTAESGGMTEEEMDQAARQLAVGSVVFNDLKSDMKGTVSIARGELTPTITAFEKSGGPYVVYSACRARAILRKYNQPLPEAADIASFDVSDQESLLILRLMEFPEKVAKAADEGNSAILVRHLLDLAGIYNSYYASSPVLQGGQANEFRLLITKSVQSVLVNGLSLCHVECPPKI
ncbi:MULTISPECIES: arginine--tRNA ligase domain-containing protein [Streptomyces]|uniref:arginine--tRNA ligase domain-containing protein n=1 Tax=Streptomyces TaxID=1883 RepID=UPI0022718AAD|nr:MULTISPECIES: arginine--tRNA ligase [unclassified Streptomyces]MCY0940138.1 arginine--tRNA ligase [Streptomyces sp. H34-AA3]MCZ4080786.1 arginine--tRNA ligase [Streptomyces sp. H34-S5]